MADQTVISLRPFDTQLVFGLSNKSPGLYRRDFTTTGNSLLSSVFIKTADPGATLSIRYYQTTGATEDDGEKQFLGQHQLLDDTDAPSTHSVLVAKFHDKPFVECTVTGGNIDFSLYATLLTQNASDIDAALQLDGTVIDVDAVKGMPIMGYDPASGKVFFIRTEGGVIPVSFSEAGDPVHLSSGVVVSTPGTSQDLITSTVPIAKVRKLTQATVVCRQHGFYRVTLDGAIIGSGRTGPANNKDSFTWSPRLNASAGQIMKVTFTALTGSSVSDVEAYLMGSDI